MHTFSEIGFKKRPLKEILLFLMGLFSSMQILQFFGFAISTWLTVLTAGYLLLTQGFDFRKDLHLLAMFLFTLVTFAVSMLSDIPADYKSASTTSTLQWVLIFLICAYVRKEKTGNCADAFLKGLDISCMIQLLWCVLQMLLWYSAKKDLNSIVFRDLLHMSQQTSQYRKGVLACTGLHWHAANMIPVIFYAYFRFKNIFIKLLCFVIVYLTKNATALIAITGAVCLEFLIFAKRTLCDNRCSIRRKIAVYAVLFCGVFLLVSPILIPKVRETVQYLFTRIYQIKNPTQGNESSAVHFNYYKNLPYILKNIPPTELLFGSGIATSGYRFTQFFNQYDTSVWVVESDFVDAILSRGIVGMLLQYGLQLRLIWLAAKQKRTDIACFVTVLLAAGFIYDNQFLWVQLTIFLMYCSTFTHRTKENALKK